jgi:hypothetical protein
MKNNKHKKKESKYLEKESKIGHKIVGRGSILQAI